MRRLLSFSFALALFAGCGRSGVLGGDDVNNGCPPGQVPDIHGNCVPIPTLPDFSKIGDGGPPSFDGFHPPDGFKFPDGGNCQTQPEICNNGVDDNCNGLVDCADPSCAGDTHCKTPGVEICNNGIDDDNNGLTDCADPACANFPACQKPHMCDPNNPDCTDPACVNDPHCKDLKCMPTVDFGTLQPNDSKSEKMISTVGTKDVGITPCAPPGGGMVVTEFTVAADNTAVRLDFTQPNTADNVFALFRAGVNQPCDANPVVPNGCYDPSANGPATSGTHTWILNAGEYYLIMQAHEVNGQGSADVTLSTPSSKHPEICDNGVDDDGNGLIDCADPACFGDAHCKNQECMPDVNVGTIVLNAPPKMASFDTTNHPNNLTLSCANNKGGDEEVLEFSVAQTEGILMLWDQMGNHDIGLFQMPPPGQPCNADPIPMACYLPDDRQQDEVAWGELPPGNYLFIFKAEAPGDEGPVDVQLSAYENRKIELCHNGIDDDGNGLIDCADPACFQDPGCGAPSCNPDVNVGTLNLNDSANVTLDVTKGILNEQVSCAKGGGKAKIVEVTLAQNAGMGFQCNDTGQDVLGLFAAGAPRDSCDKFEVACGDPGIIPFGCNYEIPNLQPGTYYVIVEGLKAGSEGKVNLTLSSIPDEATEICNNGIDDDMDGFTDCADKKCATYVGCLKTQCTADATIDPMPLDGSPVFKLVQTAGAKAVATLPCATKPGGDDAVVFLNMPAQANLEVDFTQIGNHDVAVYPDLGQGILCDAAPALICVQSGGMGSGMVTVPNVPQGKYWVVIGADSPGQEGSASLRFTATK